MKPGLPCGILAMVLPFVSASLACVGDGCLQIWSTEPGAGSLILRHDFAEIR
jgi:hypothetical protein